MCLPPGEDEDAHRHRSRARRPRFRSTSKGAGSHCPRNCLTALDLPRLGFSGDFQAEVSTVNNDVRHYDTATFQPRFQHLRTGPSSDGWWNPSGSGVFRLLDCSTARSARSCTATEPASRGWMSRSPGQRQDRRSGPAVAPRVGDLEAGARVEDADGGTVFEAEFEPAPSATPRSVARRHLCRTGSPPPRSTRPGS
jgi:hypothetical protein